MTHHLIAIDLGASGGRVLAVRLTSTGSRATASLAEIHRFEHGPAFLPHDRGQTLHWDVLRLWSEILVGLRRAAHSGGPAHSIGVDTWGVDFALVDGAGRLLENPVAYRDGRTRGMLARACERMPREEIFRRTGLQFMELNTVYQLLGLQAQESDLLQRADRLLMMPDLFHYWLSGSKSCEFTNASTTQMVNAETRGWDRGLLSRLNLPDHFLPDIVEAGSPLGTLRSDVAGEVGLLGLIPVVAPATHDTGSAVVATPGSGCDWAFLSAGTWCLFGAEVDRPQLTDAVLRNGFSNEGGVCGTTRLLRNITGLWLVQECRRSWAEQGDVRDYGELAALASEARPFVTLLDPDDPAFAQPTDMPRSIAEYAARTGQTAPGTAGEFVRSCLESIALTVRRRLEQLEAILRRRLAVIHMVGGGCRNRLLCRFVADATGRTVLAGPVEATALGNALTQAVGLGVLDYAAAREVVRRSVELEEYAPGDGGPWDDAATRAEQVRMRQEIAE